MISKMAEPPENGVRMVVFLTEVDFNMRKIKPSVVRGRRLKQELHL